MRQIRQSENYSNRQWLGLLALNASNTSTKPYSRLMHSLHDCANPKPAGLPRQFVFVSPRPNRAQRRAAMFANVKPAAPVQVEVARERKLTGAVRRGLERGKSA